MKRIIPFATYILPALAVAGVLTQIAYATVSYNNYLTELHTTDFADELISIELPTPDEEIKETPDPEPEENPEEEAPFTPVVEGSRDDCKGGAVACSVHYYETHPEAYEYDQQDPYWYMDPITKEQTLWKERTGIVTGEDFLKAYAGVCPSAQDTPSSYKKAMDPYLAAISSHVSYPSVEFHVEQGWAFNKLQRITSGTNTILLNSTDYEAYPNSRFGSLVIDWGTLQVSISSTYTTYPDYWYEAQARAQKHLDYIVSTYNSLCPND